LGQRCRVRKLHDDGKTTLVSAYPEGVKNPVKGLFGGQAGCEPYAKVYDKDGKLVQDCGTGALIALEDSSRVVEVRLAGGSGYGDPLERPRDLVARDVKLGYVSGEGAERDYGAQVAAAPEPAHAE